MENISLTPQVSDRLDESVLANLIIETVHGGPDIAVEKSVSIVVFVSSTTLLH
jgi:hypothetical protein